MSEHYLGRSLFYAEIGPSESIRAKYAPDGRCEECGAKLSRYRNKQYGEWETFCSPCMIEGKHKGPRERTCEGCGNDFLAYGTREVCSQCLVPSYRMKRSIAAVRRAQEAERLFNEGVSLAEIASMLGYSDAGLVGRSIDKLHDNGFLAQVRGWVDEE